MKSPYEEHITQENFEALRQDRDRWANLAMEERQYILQLEETIRSLQTQLDSIHQAEEETTSLPPENDYRSLAQWLVAEKTLGNDYYIEAGFNRSKMCRELRKILGWEPDQNSLRKAQNK